MFTEHFLTILSKKGVATILTWANAEPHLTATWSSYITVKEKLLVPSLNHSSRIRSLPFSCCLGG